jgi:predicted TIM-barrel fold metal-dependent hydrolase
MPSDIKSECWATSSRIRGRLRPESALRHLAAQVGISQIMLGSDHPYPWQDHPVDHIMATTSLSDDDKLAILGGNAAKVFGMKV